MLSTITIEIKGYTLILFEVASQREKNPAGAGFFGRLLLLLGGFLLHRLLLGCHWLYSE
jgi:hypothetical protein